MSRSIGRLHTRHRKHDMTPYYADDQVTLYHGDALDVLRTLPDMSVDVDRVTIADGIDVYCYWDGGS